MLPGGYRFRAGNVQQYVWGTEILACKERGETRSGKPRFYGDVASAIRSLEKENIIRKIGRTWQRGNTLMGCIIPLGDKS